MCLVTEENANRFNQVDVGISSIHIYVADSQCKPKFEASVEAQD